MAVTKTRAEALQAARLHYQPLIAAAQSTLTSAQNALQAVKDEYQAHVDGIKAFYDVYENRIVLDNPPLESQ